MTSTEPFLKRRHGSALIRRSEVANFCMPEGAVYTSSPLGSPPAPLSEACSDAWLTVQLAEVTAPAALRRACPPFEDIRASTNMSYL